jgi:putative FmdB family regulatory protein
MPVYEYTCQNCQKTFSISRPISEAASGGGACPSCGSSNTERTWSSVYAITGKKS